MNTPAASFPTIRRPKTAAKVLHWVHEGIFPEIVIIRGLPGSGKSWTAVHGFPLHVHCEADAFHIDDETGVYQFVQERAREAHAYCRGMAECALALGYPAVVSNTFTQEWEVAPYRQLARKYDVFLRVYVAGGDFKNIHGVPESVIQAMRERWEEVEGEVFL